ncbi:MAG: hypothetical protein HFI87_03615, partial [Bacilli bacterium]|nr:hypothetical protein [Bacilli bacterium]
MNKKFIRNLTYIIASFLLLIGGIFTYSLINNKKIYFSEDDVLLAATNYIKENDIGIGDELEIPVSLLKANGFLGNDVICTNDSYITVKNIDDEYIYESNLSCNNITTITDNVVYMTANTINETIHPQIPLAYKGPTYSITSRTNKNVTVTIVTNLDILDVDGWTKVNSKTISKTFSNNSTETIKIYAKNSVNNYREISINVNNIDKYEPTITGVVNGTTYTQDVTIGFNKVFNGSIVPVTAKLNGKNFENGQVVSKDGNYTLVVTDDIGNSKTVSFIVDKTAPEVTGVVNNGHYNHDVTINFNEGNATLNGDKIDNGHLIIANTGNEKEYKLVVIDTAGNKNEITFWIDITGPSVINDGIKYSPVLVDGKTSADTIVTITYNEEISLSEGSDWSISASNSKQIYKQFNGENNSVVNINDTIVVNDLAGNQSAEETINFIIDKKSPEIVGEIEYSPVLKGGRTTSDTTVTITYNEAIKLGEDSEWSIVEGTNNTQITRTFVGTENAETVVNENVSVSDLVGNQSVETIINFTIDKK